jgi:hypothetical protein
MKAFAHLAPGDQEAARGAFNKTFKTDPFHPSLNTHKINRLCSLMRKTVFSVTIKGNLKAAFYLEGNVVVSFDIGTHDIYQ